MIVIDADNLQPGAGGIVCQLIGLQIGVLVGVDTRRYSAVSCTVSNACLPVAGILSTAPFIFVPLGGCTAPEMRTASGLRVRRCVWLSGVKVLTGAIGWRATLSAISSPPCFRRRSSRRWNRSSAYAGSATRCPQSLLSTTSSPTRRAPWMVRTSAALRGRPGTGGGGGGGRARDRPDAPAGRGQEQRDPRGPGALRHTGTISLKYIIP